MTVVYYLFLFLFLLVALILCLVILVQESKGGGLGSTFGGGGGDAGDSLFGVSTPDILKKITAVLSVIFLGGCILLSFWTGAMGRMHAKRAAQTEIIEK